MSTRTSKSKKDPFSDHEKVDPNVYVVSNGAEVIIISAPFYRDNMNEKCSAVLTLKLESILKHDYVNEMRIKNNYVVVPVGLRRGALDISSFCRIHRNSPTPSPWETLQYKKNAIERCTI